MKKSYLTVTTFYFRVLFEILINQKMYLRGRREKIYIFSNGHWPLLAVPTPRLLLKATKQTTSD